MCVLYGIYGVFVVACVSDTCYLHVLRGYRLSVAIGTRWILTTSCLSLKRDCYLMDYCARSSRYDGVLILFFFSLSLPPPPPPILFLSVETTSMCLCRILGTPNPNLVWRVHYAVQAYGCIVGMLLTRARTQTHKHTHTHAHTHTCTHTHTHTHICTYHV